jgi:hypothetical protein
MRTLSSVVLAISISLNATSGAEVSAAQSAEEGKREFTITGCLLRSGYATYKLDAAKVDAIDGKPMKDLPPDLRLARVTAWNLEGGGNLGSRTGEKVQVVGLTTWKEADDSEEPRKTPVLEVKSVKTVTASCS